MTINDRLRLIRELMKESQAKFSSRFGLPQTTYANYELNKRSVPDELKNELASIGINLHWLITGNGDMYLNGSGNTDIVSTPKPTFMTPRGKAYAVNIADDVLSVPILVQKLSAGDGQSFLPTDIIDERLPVLERFVRMYPKEKIFAAEVRGDSMTGIQLFDADIVIFVKNIVEGDGLYVISVDGEVFVKRVEYNPFDKQLTIRSENDRYAPKVVPADRVDVLGKVVGWLHHHPY